MRHGFRLISAILCIFFVNLVLMPNYSFASPPDPEYQLTQKGGLEESLYRLNTDKRRILGNILWKVDEGDKRLSPDELTPESIQNKLMFVYGNAVTCWFGRFRDVPYSEIVVAVAENMNIPTAGKSFRELEMEILTTHTRLLWDKMDEKQKREATKEVIAQLKKDNLWYSLDEKTKDTITHNGPVAAMMGLMEYGGFTTYKIAVSIAMKTAAAIAAAIGVTIPFIGGYTLIALVVTKGLNIMLGPIGWSAFTGWTAWKVFNTNYQKLTAFIEAFAILRYSDGMSVPAVPRSRL